MRTITASPKSNLSFKEKVALQGKPRLGEIRKVQVRIKESKEFKVSIANLIYKSILQWRGSLVAKLWRQKISRCSSFFLDPKRIFRKIEKGSRNVRKYVHSTATASEEVAVESRSFRETASTLRSRRIEPLLSGRDSFKIIKQKWNLNFKSRFSLRAFFHRTL